MFSKAITISALAACASAHVIMDYPTPYGRATLNTSPLAPADFPCKQRTGVYEITKMNQWDAGETQQVSFNGTAVHGGGSCQFSITTDAEPTVNSQWKVIQSYVGGCPTGQYPGNAPEQGGEPSLTRVPGSLPVTMPKDIPDGRYTFSWTWVNKIGNREFYMNCAPIQVGGGGASASTASAAKALSALPDMFVINLPDTQCSSAEKEDFVFPNPGANAVTSGSPGKTMTGSGCTKQNAMGAGAGSIGSPSEGTPSTPSQGTPSTPSQGAGSKPSGGYSAPVASPINKGPSDSKPTVNPGGVFAPGASSAPAVPSPQPAEPAQPAKPSAPADKPSAPSAPSAAPQAPNNSTPSNGECTPCTNDGGVVCIGSKQFGLCNRGCAVAQDLAAGMSCANGAVVASVKRHINFPRAHIHRRLSAARLI